MPVKDFFIEETGTTISTVAERQGAYKKKRIDKKEFLALLKDLPEHSCLGLGVVNPKSSRVENVEEIIARAEQAIGLLGPQRLLLNPDCGFATFADSPIAPADIAQAKLAAIVQAAQQLRDRYC